MDPLLDGEDHTPGNTILGIKGTIHALLCILDSRNEKSISYSHDSVVDVTCGIKSHPYKEIRKSACLHITHGILAHP